MFSRKTVNKYDFWSLTPFAFGISPELSAENKKKSDARKRDFDKREALLKFDPMYQHKYTRRMIELGAEPDTAEVESITPHYGKLKYPGGKQNCPCCQKLSTKDPKINASHFATSNYAIFDTLNVDYVGPFPDEGYILVIIDTFTR